MQDPQNQNNTPPNTPTPTQWDPNTPAQPQGNTYQDQPAISQPVTNTPQQNSNSQTEETQQNTNALPTRDQNTQVSPSYNQQPTSPADSSYAQNPYGDMNTNQQNNSTTPTQSYTEPVVMQNPYQTRNLQTPQPDMGDGQYMQNQTQIQHDQQQSPISVHTGSPESAPTTLSPEATSEDKVEFGYEKLRQIEQGTMELEKIENKESMSQNPTDELQDQSIQSEVLPDPGVVKSAGPKIFGYQIPKSITSNLTNIKARKGTGDPQDATTWIYVLLDKLLKKQTYQKEKS